MALSGAGALVFSLSSSTAAAKWWTGSAWVTAPIWTGTGSAWRITNLQIMRSLTGTVHGMYAGTGSTGSAAINTFNASKGTNITLAHDSADWTSWQTLTSSSLLSVWDTWCGVSPARRLVYSIGLLTATDDPSLTVQQKYQNLAFGLYDTYFTALGAAFQSSANLKDATIKLGPRMNTAGFAWSLPSGDEDAFRLYAYAYNRAAALMKAQCPTLTFEWTTQFTLADTKRAIADLYPGDDFVDYIGLTLFDCELGANGVSTSESVRFDWLQTGVNGLNDHVAFAATRGKRPVLSVWGLVPPDDPCHGGGDDPDFMDLAVGWMTTNNFAYSIYNNTNSMVDDVDSRLVRYPLAQAEYVTQFLSIGG